MRYDQRWISRLIAVLPALRTAGWAAALALLLGAATTVVAVVRLSFESRHEEIAIMGLVGAPVSFIRGPFVMEGALQGALGALGALAALASLGRVVGRALGPAVAALGPEALRPLSGLGRAGAGRCSGAGVGRARRTAGDLALGPGSWSTVDTSVTTPLTLRYSRIHAEDDEAACPS